MIDGPRLAPLQGGAPQQLVVLIHGYGSNGDDLIGLAPHWQAALPHAAFVSPNAPTRCQGTAGGYEWWPIRSFAPDERAQGAVGAAPVLDAFLDAELARTGLADDKVLLVGFSQGTMMALHVGLRRQKPVAGILGYSGMLVAPETLARDIRSRPPVLLVHGDADPVVPFAALAEATRVLAASDVPVETHVSRGLGHSVDQTGLMLGGQFARRVLIAEVPSG